MLAPNLGVEYEQDARRRLNLNWRMAQNAHN